MATIVAETRVSPSVLAGLHRYYASSGVVLRTKSSVISEALNDFYHNLLTSKRISEPTSEQDDILYLEMFNISQGKRKRRSFVRSVIVEESASPIDKRAAELSKIMDEG